VRNPQWLVGTAGDLLGLILQLVALATGPVVLVQPLLVLSLPVAVLVRPTLGGRTPSRRELGLCAVVVLGLGLFLAVLGNPHSERLLRLRDTAWTAGLALLLGAVALALLRRAAVTPRAVGFGVVAGAWFGIAGVLVDGVSGTVSARGLPGLATPVGFTALAGLVVLAVGGYLLVQLGFQLGPLEASYPANLIVDPVVAVAFGAVLLGEDIPLGPARVLGYLLAVVLTVWAVIRLARPVAAPGGGPAGESASASGTIEQS